MLTKTKEVISKQTLNYDTLVREKFRIYVQKKCRNFDNKLRLLQNHYEPRSIFEQITWIETHFYRVTANSRNLNTFRIFDGDKEDTKTNEPEVHNAVRRKFGDNLNPIVKEYAFDFVQVLTGIQYCPFSQDAFVDIEHSMFRNLYQPPRLIPKTLDRRRPLLWQEYLDRLMPPDDFILDNEGYKTNQRQSDYFDKWIAKIVQRPELPCTVAILLRGMQGTGKGFWANVMLPPIIGQSNYKALTSKQLKGTFIQSIYHSTLLNIEEINTSDNRSQGAELLKNLLTQDKPRVEEKHERASIADRYFSLVLSSNFPEPIKIEEGDRRFFVPRFSDHKISLASTREFFTRFKNWLEKENGFQIMCDYFHSVDLSNMDFLLAPLTASKLEITEDETSQEAKIEQAALEISNLESCAFKISKIQEEFGLTQPSAKRALAMAGCEKKRLRPKGFKNAINVYVHKDYTDSLSLFEKRKPNEYRNTIEEEACR